MDSPDNDNSKVDVKPSPESQEEEPPEISKDDGVENPNKDEEEDGVDGEDGKADKGVEEPTDTASKQEEQTELKDDNTEKEMDSSSSKRDKIELEQFDGKSLNQALEEQRQAEKEAFQKLIEENVSLQRQAEKAKNELGDVEAKRDLLLSELKEQKETNEELKKSLRSLEDQLQMVQKESENVAQTEMIEKDGDSPEIPHNDDDEPHGKSPEISEADYHGKLPDDAKIKYLQVRIKRMTKDGESKDETIQKLQDSLNKTDSIVGQLKELVSEEQYQKIIAEQDNGDNINTTSANTEQNSPQAQHSKVCTIL